MKASLALAVLVVSSYSFHLVEDPVRRSHWLERRRQSRREPGSPRRPLLTPRQRNGWLSLSVLLLVALLVVAQLSVPDRRTSGALAGTALATPGADGAAATATSQLQAELQQAVTATSWPELTPSLDDVVGGRQAPDDVLACGTSASVDVAACSWGPQDAQQTVVVVGDSMSMTYVTTFREALPDWRVVSLGGFGCTFTDKLIANGDEKLQENCPQRKEEAVRTINELRPDLLVVSNTHFPRTPVGADTPLTEDQWEQSTLTLLDRVRDAAGKVVLLAPPPADKDVTSCWSRLGSPQDCVGTVTQEWQDRATSERRLAASLQGAWVDSTPWFCVGGRCPAFGGTTPVKVDLSHMTAAWAMKIAPAVRESFVTRGLLGTGSR